jgi:putative cell wall hydrolase
MSDVLNLNNKKENDNSVDALRENVANIAKEQVSKKKGNNYVWGAKGPDYFDCSGLTKQVYADAGLFIPDGSSNQASYGGLTPNLKKDDLQVGDLVFFGKGKVTHVAIYIGNGQIIDSGGRNSRGQSGAGCSLSNPCEGVRIKPLNYRSDFRGGLSLEKVLEKNRNDKKIKNKGNIKKGLEGAEKTVSTPQSNTPANNINKSNIKSFTDKLKEASLVTEKANEEKNKKKSDDIKTR